MVNTSVKRFEKAGVGGVELEYEVRGAGEPVLFIHGSIMAEAFAPLLDQPSLAGYRLVSYHRRGFAGSARATEAMSIKRQAADAREMLDHLGIETAHVVGHSYGAVIALQLALDAPERVHTLALLEPATLSSAAAAEFVEQARPLFQMYHAGDKAGAIEGFCQAVAGPRYREAVDRVLAPGWFEQAVADADTFFQIEVPAFLEWDLTQELARGISQPSLSVLGADSAAVDQSVEVAHELLQKWLPRIETFVLPNATHALQMMNPGGMAQGLAEFFHRHPISDAA
jgi:pimeloyl-ACP methyl ester carboxylesterase